MNKLVYNDWLNETEESHLPSQNTKYYQENNFM